MSNYLLISWTQIRDDFFLDKEGKPIISVQTLRKKYGPEMKRLGVVRRLGVGIGKKRIRGMCGWQWAIRNYFTLKNQKAAEREGKEKRNPLKT